MPNSAPRRPRPQASYLVPQVLVVDPTAPNTLYTATTDLGIFKSVDGGVTWNAEFSGTHSWLYGAFFANDNLGFVVGDAGTILRTTDGGYNWTPQLSSFRSTLYGISFAVTGVATAVGAGGAILRSTDFGATWAQGSDGATGTLFAVSPAVAGGRTIVGDLGIILRTADGGATWQTQSRSSTLNTLNAVFFVDSKTGAVVGANGTILRTTDGGASCLCGRPCGWTKIEPITTSVANDGCCPACSR